MSHGTPTQTMNGTTMAVVISTRSATGSDIRCGTSSQLMSSDAG